MAYSNSTGDRMDELRFRSQQPSRNDSPLFSPPRTRAQPLPHPESFRSSLTRRFTTDGGSRQIPTIASLSSMRGGLEDYGSSTNGMYHKQQLLEKKKLEYERLKEQKRRFELEMQILDLQQRREEQELAQMQQDLSRPAEHRSEPTTPPEYRESSSGFPSAFSRPNRYSTSSLTSPPGLYNRPGRSGSTLISPKSAVLQSRLMMEGLAKSGPASRRNSDEDEKEEAVRQDPTSHRATNALNRYSMPVTRSRNGAQEMFSPDQNTLDQTNTTRFLFGEENGASIKQNQNFGHDESFPTLTAHGITGVLSASQTALDLASSQSPGPDGSSNGWSSFARHRPGQNSLPMNSFHGQASSGNGSTSASASQSTTAESPISVRPASYRHSSDIKSYYDGQEPTSPVASPGHVQTPPKLQSSYSTNDVPTMRSTNGLGSPTSNTPNSHAQQHLHNHNASLGRIPANAMSNRLSRELPSPDTSTLREAQNGGYQSIQSALHAGAPAFGPSLAQNITQAQLAPTITSPSSLGGYPGQYYNGYNMQMMAMGMQNMQMGPPLYSPHNPYAYGQQMYPPQQAPLSNGRGNGGRDSQAQVIAQRRQNDSESMNRFTNLALESLGGEIYGLCKDQHGCRYLQKKLEERNPEQIHMIWLETNQHVVELMTDPFGNYLCQKLLEYCNDEERTVMIENASEELVRIALNQHGTRALQKMIEFISTPGQVQTIIAALQHRVVELIQDLNGNHVIQKCLNKLSAEDAQFIFEAVGTNCVDVGTHRHGCCVLQRCIDHAVGHQKAWLIRQISDNAFVLVQDPFGNYVVQYILDLNEQAFTEPLVAMFAGRVPQLSKQKFSSNVIEKCLRVAQEPSKDMLIEEMLQPAELAGLLRDSFANYVIQTALDYANPQMKDRLVDAIRPHLPAIRTTPYGRRIQAKIQGNEGRLGHSNGTPKNGESGQISLRDRHNRGLATGGFIGSTYSVDGYSTPNKNGNGIPPPQENPVPFPGGGPRDAIGRDGNWL